MNRLNENSNVVTEGLISYNDYIELTRGYLKSYFRFKSTIKELEEDKKNCEKRLDECLDISAGIAKYGNVAPSGGGSIFGNGVVDRAAEKRERVTAQLTAINEDIAALKDVTERINVAVMMLPSLERDLIRQHFFECTGWTTVAKDLGMSQRWVSEKGNEAIRKIALMLFGNIATMPDLFRFRFALA